MGRASFVLASTLGGPMIVSRLDYAEKDAGNEIGVGFGLLDTGSHEPDIMRLVADIAHFRRETVGDGVAIIDGGANIGSHTVAWARTMDGDVIAGTRPWGKVVAFEPQEWPFYACCGNLALNNCFNASATRTALAGRGGLIRVPSVDPQRPNNYGATSLIGETGDGPGSMVQAVSIDGLGLIRLDIVKLDVEGMEPEVLEGARQTIERLKPVLIVEWRICGKDAIAERLPGYEVMSLGMDVLAIHRDDPVLERIKLVGEPQT